MPWHSPPKRAGPCFLSAMCVSVEYVCVGGPKEPRLPRILHSCLDVLWHSRPTAVFCFPGPRAYFERHSHGQHNRSTLSLSHTHSSTTHSTIYLGAAIAFHFKYGRRNVYIRYLYLVLPIYLICILCTYLVGIWVCSVGTRRYLVHKVLVACSYASVLPIIGNEYIKSSVSHFVFVLCIRLSDTHSMKIP